MSVSANPQLSSDLDTKDHKVHHVVISNWKVRCVLCGEWNQALTCRLPHVMYTKEWGKVAIKVYIGLRLSLGKKKKKLSAYGMWGQYLQGSGSVLHKDV